MSLEGGKWTQWRDAPAFSQRFVGVLRDNGNTITARWEKSFDGTNWEHDFDLTYTRRNQNGGHSDGKEKQNDPPKG